MFFAVILNMWARCLNFILGWLAHAGPDIETGDMSVDPGLNIRCQVLHGVKSRPIVFTFSAALEVLPEAPCPKLLCLKAK